MDEETRGNLSKDPRAIIVATRLAESNRTLQFVETGGKTIENRRDISKRIDSARIAKIGYLKAHVKVLKIERNYCMSDLFKLTDQVLIEATDRVVAREREVLISVLEHLREMERRRLFSALGYASLWEYATKRLKYSEDQAWRRISAMRMMKELPEIEKSRTLVREEKTALLEQLENKSKREAEQIMLKQSSAPAQVKPDKIKAVAGLTCP
jgi:NAD-dependent DNA ligase